MDELKGDKRAVLQRDLINAAMEGRVGPLKLLLLSGADPDGVAGSPLRPLSQAIAAGRSECALALIKAGASVGARQSDAGYSPVALAACMCDERALDALLMAGADINEAFDPGGSAFLLALSQDNEWGLKMLTDRGALPYPLAEVRQAIEGKEGSPAALRAKALWEAVALSEIAPKALSAGKPQRSL